MTATRGRAEKSPHRPVIVPVVRLLEQRPHLLRRVVVPVRIVEVEEQEERPVAEAVEEVDGAVGHVGGPAVLVEVEVVEPVVEAVHARHVEMAGHGLRRVAGGAQERGQRGHAAGEAVAHVDAAVRGRDRPT